MIFLMDQGQPLKKLCVAKNTARLTDKISVLSLHSSNSAMPLPLSPPSLLPLLQPARLPPMKRPPLVRTESVVLATVGIGAIALGRGVDVEALLGRQRASAKADEVVESLSPFLLLLRSLHQVL